MSNETLIKCLEGVEEHGEKTGVWWSSWGDASTVVSAFANGETLTLAERQVIQNAIDTNGKSLPSDLRNLEIIDCARVQAGDG